MPCNFESWRECNCNGPLIVTLYLIWKAFNPHFLHCAPFTHIPRTQCTSNDYKIEPIQNYSHFPLVPSKCDLLTCFVSSFSLLKLYNNHQANWSWRKHIKLLRQIAHSWWTDSYGIIGFSDQRQMKYMTNIKNIILPYSRLTRCKCLQFRLSLFSTRLHVV